MKKLILCMSVYLVATTSFKSANADEPVLTQNKTVATSNHNSTNATSVSDIYNKINFGSRKLDFNVFEKAYRGYTALKAEGKLTNTDVLTVCDFSKSSTQYRLWVIDLKENKVLFNDYVAHGQGSGNEFATAFSNTNNSHQSSLGFYVTADTYIGKHGKSLRMHGMDKGYNSAAYDRAVVVHGADYVSADFVAGQKRLGRSWGCPAVSNKIAGPMIDAIKGGTCLFVYAPKQDYLQSSVWLNKGTNNVQIASNSSQDSTATVN